MKKLIIGWKTRHLLVMLIAVIGVYLFLELRAQWSDMHRWNRAIGDMSFVLIAISMAAGPLSRLIKFPFTLSVWRRAFGIYSVILAIIHTIIILAGWLQWDLIGIFGFQMHPSGVYVMVQHGFGLANLIGIIALIYGVILALISNNISQKFLSGSVWKFLQQGAYVLWVLIIIHTAYFLFLHFLDYHKAIPEPNIMRMPFVILVLIVSILQILAFLKTWRLKLKKHYPEI